MKYDIFILLILLLFSLFIFYIDMNTDIMKDCLNKKTTYSSIIIITLLHHILQIFANFGWLFNNKIILTIYVLAPFIVIIHWLTNDGKCVLTQLYNKQCSLPDERKFNDIYNIVGFKKYDIWEDYLHYIYLSMAIIITIYKLYKK